MSGNLRNSSTFPGVYVEEIQRNVHEINPAPGGLPKSKTVRSLTRFLERSLVGGLQWAVLEPNDEQLWATIRISISSFLEGLWRDGVLVGATPKDAYFVKCDRETMSANDLAEGRLIVIVGFACRKSAEFSLLRIEQKVAGSS